MRRPGRPSAIKIGAILLGVAVLSTTPTLAQAQVPKEEHKLTLRVIMQELEADYLRLTNALLVDDFKGLENWQRPSKLIHCLTKSLRQ